jgi:hypothetical protein
VFNAINMIVVVVVVVAYVKILYGSYYSWINTADVEWQTEMSVIVN